MSNFASFEPARLACVLKHANTCRDDLNKFYAAKDCILRNHGEHVGFDLQEINYECWTCHGEGCSRCHNGIYRSLTFILERWRLASHTFHIPRGRDSILEQYAISPTRIIKGRIRHHKSKIGPACQRLIVAIHTGSVFDYFAMFGVESAEIKKTKKVYAYLIAKTKLLTKEDELVPF